MTCPIKGSPHQQSPSEPSEAAPSTYPSTVQTQPQAMTIVGVSSVPSLSDEMEFLSQCEPVCDSDFVDSLLQNEGLSSRLEDWEAQDFDKDLGNDAPQCSGSEEPMVQAGTSVQRVRVSENDELFGDERQEFRQFTQSYIQSVVQWCINQCAGKTPTKALHQMKNTENRPFRAIPASSGSIKYWLMKANHLESKFINGRVRCLITKEPVKSSTPSQHQQSPPTQE